jgi:hypothetical protein
MSARFEPPTSPPPTHFTEVDAIHRMAVAAGLEPPHLINPGA